ncbi:putative AdoMet-dependent methyltransferase [Amphibacillus marinus]|uniref:Uncharacterized methyltransferase SAMN04488134_104147 n=1 Tax=Amphibacillus marinus TaxID=872970 RepID=A0A1H8MGC4_9BACI|nr:class I SAM-dependent methyltransferase [Amphibacillus marinus]SEO16445.1 putative AdoMet-dependent methyltransferase [Amphibacillus marinus]
MGREFLGLFDKWADDYDNTVSGLDNEYHDVFLHYDQILDQIVKQATGVVVEFGSGTGNLTKKLHDANMQVIAIEPSPAMRAKASEKIPTINIYDGDFLNFPAFDKEIDTIVSSYAFHHLTDAEKQEAIVKYNQLLPVNGRVVFADTLFQDETKKQAAIEKAESNLAYNLAQDLRTEYYPLLETLRKIFIEAGFSVSFQQMNDFAWIIFAEKKKEV